MCQVPRVLRVTQLSVGVMWHPADTDAVLLSPNVRLCNYGAASLDDIKELSTTFCGGLAVECDETIAFHVALRAHVSSETAHRDLAAAFEEVATQKCQMHVLKTTGAVQMRLHNATFFTRAVIPRHT